MVQQQKSEKEREVKKEEAISTPVQIEEQNSMPDGKGREEVQEEIVENGLAFEVELALSNFQLSWDSAGKKDVTGNMLDLINKWILVRHHSMNTYQHYMYRRRKL